MQPKLKMQPNEENLVSFYPSYLQKTMALKSLERLGVVVNKTNVSLLILIQN